MEFYVSGITYPKIHTLMKIPSVLQDTDDHVSFLENLKQFRIIRAEITVSKVHLPIPNFVRVFCFGIFSKQNVINNY